MPKSLYFGRKDTTNSLAVSADLMVLFLFTRFNVDVISLVVINAVAVVKQLSHLPVIVDPSHATGKWNLVESASKASIAAGCDGLMIEVHDNPEDAFSDGSQSLLPETFSSVMGMLKNIAAAVSREI